MNTCSTDQVLLDFVYFYVQTHLPLAELRLNEPDVKIMLDEKLKVIRLLVKGYLCGKYFKPIIIEYPDGWWEAFRARWFPKWWLKTHPVKHVKHNIQFRQFYPDFRPALSHLHSKVKVSHWDNKGHSMEADVEGEEVNEQ